MLIEKHLYRFCLQLALPLEQLLCAAAPKENLKSDQAFDNKIVKQIKEENIYNHIAELSKNPRVAGTPAEDEAVQYIKHQFESYGYETELQEFDIYSYTAPA